MAESVQLAEEVNPAAGPSRRPNIVRAFWSILIVGPDLDLAAVYDASKS